MTKRTRTGSLVLALLALVGALGAEAALAKVMHKPMPVRLAQASAVALVEVARSAEYDSLAELDVIEVFSGNLQTGRVEVTDPRNLDCFGSETLAIGERHVALFHYVGGTWDIFWTYPTDQIKKVRDVLAQLPRWSKTIDPFRVRIVPESFERTHSASCGSSGLYLIVHNDSYRAVDLKIATWPDDDALWLDLRARAEDGSLIEMERIPTLTDEDIEEHTPHLAREWTRRLPMGTATDVYLGSFDTDAQGWGYREMFLFRSLPIPASGRYQISATVHGLLADETFETAPLWLTYAPAQSSGASGASGADR